MTDGWPTVEEFPGLKWTAAEIDELIYYGMEHYIAYGI